MARIAVGNNDEALDLVQEAMYKLVQRYADKNEAEWTLLFYKILQSKIRDWYRRQKVKNKVMSWFNTDSENRDIVDTHVDSESITPESSFEQSQSMNEVTTALHQLPHRQQQAFLLRCWQGLSVDETAKVMSCSQGSVKTHLSRALHSLRNQLGENLGHEETI